MRASDGEVVVRARRGRGERRQTLHFHRRESAASRRLFPNTPDFPQFSIGSQCDGATIPRKDSRFGAWSSFSRWEWDRCWWSCGSASLPRFAVGLDFEMLVSSCPRSGVLLGVESSMPTKLSEFCPNYASRSPCEDTVMDDGSGVKQGALLHISSRKEDITKIALRRSPYYLICNVCCKTSFSDRTTKTQPPPGLF